MWFYNDAPFENFENYIGFVYEITNLVDGRMYIGKKLFQRAQTRAPLKGKKRKRRSKVESDWKEYFGSNEELLSDLEKHGPGNFSRKILYLCRTKGECSYLELREQMVRDVLKHPELFYNAYVGARINRKHLEKLNV